MAIGALDLFHLVFKMTKRQNLVKTRLFIQRLASIEINKLHFQTTIYRPGVKIVKNIIGYNLT